MSDMARTRLLSLVSVAVLSAASVSCSRGTPDAKDAEAEVATPMPRPEPWRFESKYAGKTGANDIEVAACDKDQLPRGGLKVSSLETIETEPGSGMVTLNPIAALGRRETLCVGGRAIKGVSAESRVPINRTGFPLDGKPRFPVSDAYVDARNSTGILVKGTPEKPVVVAGLEFRAEVVLAVASDGLVQADREGVLAANTTGKSQWLSSRDSDGRIVFLPR